MEKKVQKIFVVREKKKMEITAADSLVIICFVEVIWSFREKGACGAHGIFKRQVEVGVDSSLHGWG